MKKYLVMMTIISLSLNSDIKPMSERIKEDNFRQFLNAEAGVAAEDIAQNAVDAAKLYGVCPTRARKILFDHLVAKRTTNKYGIDTQDPRFPELNAQTKKMVGKDLEEYVNELFAR
jgi:hypothetical protein